jgi:hypothetical protein
MNETARHKARENRLRRMAERQGLKLQKSRRRDQRAIDYGVYKLLTATGGSLAGPSLDAVERYLTRGA